MTELDNLLNDIENGRKRYKRFEFLENQADDCKENNRRAIQASIILRGSTDPSSTNQRLTKLQRRKRDQEAIARQEQLIEQWARAEGIWFNDLSDAIKDKQLLANHSSEAVVYYKDNMVTKIVALSHFLNPQLAIDRIVLHNIFFPATPIRIVGFGYDEGERFFCNEMNDNNTFRIVVEQPFVRGIKPTLEQIKTDIESFGFVQQKKPTSFITDYYIVSDLHEGNVIHVTGENGEPLYYDDGNPILAYIDTDMRLNTPDQGKDGKYKIDNEIIEI